MYTRYLFPRRRPVRRSGVTLIESALTLILVLTLSLGMLDFGIAVYRYNMLSEASRQLARQGIVHGKMANQLGSWGASAYNGSGADGSPIATAVRKYLVGVNPADVIIEVRWPQGSNDVDRTLHVTLKTTYRPLLIWIFNQTFTLQADSEMQIAH